jgi:hypothetical protein
MRILIVAAVVSGLGTAPVLSQTISGPPVIGVIKAFDGKTMA